MRLEHEALTDLARRIREIAGKHLDLSQYQLFFFGSRVQGSGDDRSDVDIGIEGPARIPADVMADIREEIDRLPVLYKIDFVDFSGVSGDFRREALRARELITE